MHTGPYGLGQKSSDYSEIPLCSKHHRTGSDSYHRLGPRRFSEVHNLDIRAIVSRLNLKPLVRLEAGCLVAHLEGEGPSARLLTEAELMGKKTAGSRRKQGPRDSAKNLAIYEALVALNHNFDEILVGVDRLRDLGLFRN
jgi:hypothetical protein